MKNTSESENTDFFDDPYLNLSLGDYMILRRIGSGAMADVYLAKQISLDREIALKILKEDLSNDETGVRRFVQEAQAAARLEHPNIVHIYEVGSVLYPGTASKQGPFSFLRRFFSRKIKHPSIHYIAQEYVPGLNLQQFLRMRGKLSVHQTLTILLNICSALEKAGKFGIVHRDIKPENILLSTQGTVKITDFGLAYLETMHAERSLSLTQIGLTLGTPLYMSPEQAEGGLIDFRSDLYSLGITAFHMLAGQPPFVADTPLSVILQHMNRAIPNIRDFRPEVSETFSAIIQKMMAKKPQDRFQSVTDLLDLLKKELKEVNRQTSFAEDDPDLERWNSAKIFQDQTEQDAFESSLRRNELSMTLQTSLFHLKTLKEQEHRSIWLNPQAKRSFFILIFFAFLTGIASVFFTQLSPAPFAEREQSVSIAQLNTVEEQWVFASQLGTIDAWKSVIRFFPEKEYWKRKALQQLALVYMRENNRNEAKKIFIDFIEMTPFDKKYKNFGLAGLAWCMACDGKESEAVWTLSNLRSEQNTTFDRLTEDIISKTQEMIRSRKS